MTPGADLQPAMPAAARYPPVQIFDGQVIRDSANYMPSRFMTVAEVSWTIASYMNMSARYFSSGMAGRFLFARMKI